MKVAANDHGYADVIVGQEGADRCFVGIEVYLPDAPERPSDTVAILRSLERDHGPSYALTVAPHTIQRDGRLTATATLRNAALSIDQRQWGFILDGNAVVVSLYATEGLASCEPLEHLVLSTIRTARCEP